MKEKLEKLQEMIGYQFKDPGLLTHALTHSSYANEKHWDKTDRFSFRNSQIDMVQDRTPFYIAETYIFKL